MSNVGRFIDRSPNLRVAGVSTYKKPDDIFGVKECIPYLDTNEQAEYLVRAHCRRNRPKPTGKRTPKIPVSSVGDLLSFEQSKSLLTQLQEKYRENLFNTKCGLGEPLHVRTKPDNVTNLSRTFGETFSVGDSLYPLVMPRKSAEQVNREYGDFHQQRIVSHNHYFPAERINRRYTGGFNRFQTFGCRSIADRSGLKMKNCLKEGEEHLLIVKKPYKDMEDRTKGPLGKKFIWYPYVIPEGITFGMVKRCPVDMRNLLENTWPSEECEKLGLAICHLNYLRVTFQKRDDFNINQLLTIFRAKDKENTGKLPLATIVRVLHKMYIHAEADKIRTVCLHYHLIEDEGCCSEGIKYEDLSQLLSILVPLPIVGSISPIPESMYNKDTTYRRLCADRVKEPNKDRIILYHSKTLADMDNDLTHVPDLVSPKPSTLLGLGSSDYNLPRGKEEMERIFGGIVSKEAFETTWQCLTNKLKDQNGMVSVIQFRAAMKIDFHA
ncbi:hypothetical protein KR018_009677 [Drosophila ironensis]|nr:hypothetical protein KR018_009677 [Drosophila ironensis]